MMKKICLILTFLLALACTQAHAVDYQGSHRMVVNREAAPGDTPEQVTHYYPYGGVIGDISTNENLQLHKFESKELDRTFGLDWYDIHARNYFAMLPTWDRPDSEAEKYYGIGPYVYCAGDPVNRCDYDGKLIEFAENSSIEFKQLFFAAYKALVEANAADNINKAFYDPSYTIVVSELSNDDCSGSKFTHKNNTIHWAPQQGLETDNGYIHSPMEILSHEFDHAVQHNVNPTQKNRMKTIQIPIMTIRKSVV